MRELYLELAVFALALVVFAIDLISKRQKQNFVANFSLIGILAILALALFAPPGGSAFNDSLTNDSLAIFFKRLFLLAGLIGLLGSHSYRRSDFGKRVGEYYFLFLVSLAGMMLLTSARELIVMFVAFEIMSLPLYAISGFLKKEPESIEAALKFFLIGTVSSAVMLYGFSFIYGIVGSTYLADIAGHSIPSALFYTGIILILAGISFKIALVPFHMWVPDTYQGSPTPFVAYLSVAPKAAGFALLIRLFLEGFHQSLAFWQTQWLVLAAVTMIIGNLLALPQTNLKRLLGYSGIAHVGYALLGLAAASVYGVAMLLFYFAVYLFANMGIFLVVELINRNKKSDDLKVYQGLAQNAPMVSLLMLLFLLSLGGIPFLAGFWAKLYIFLAAAQAGYLALVLLGALLSVVALFYYLKVARALYIEPPPSKNHVNISWSLALALFLTSVPIVVIGLYPSPLVNWVTQIAQSFLH